MQSIFEPLLETLETVRSLGYWHVDLRADRVCWSSQTARIHGKPPGFNPANLRRALAFVAAEDRARVRAEMTEAARQHVPFIVDARLLQPDGSLLPVRFTGDCGIQNDRAVEIWGFVEDISDEAALEGARRDAVQRAQRLLEAIEQMGDAFVLYDAEDRLVACNSRYRELYALSAPAIRPGARFEEILRFGLARGQYPDGIGREEAWLADRLRAHREPPEQPIEQQLGDGRWLEIKESKTVDGGRVGFRIDITERKALESKLASALFEARAAGQLHASLLPNLAHELRTPLNAVIGFAQMIQHFNEAESGSARIGEYSRIIDEAGRHLLAIINNLVDISSLERTDDPRESQVDLHEVVDQACRVSTYAGRQRSKAIRRVVPEQKVAIRGERTRLVQVLLNLISNAIKYSPVGGVIEISAEALGSKVQISVRDDGPGIEPELQSRLFRRYDRLDADRLPVSGSGLGLAIAKDFVESMGGRIDVENAPSGGAIFTIVLDRAPIQSELGLELPQRLRAG